MEGVKSSQASLADSFGQFYIDPHRIAKHTADTLTAMMDTYRSEFTSYIAPYTYLIQSSMMGKSRLMKEMSRFIPCVYICLRDGTSGYPPRSPSVADWINGGLPVRMSAERFKIDTEHELPTLKFATLLLSLLENLKLLALAADELAINTGLDVSNLSWMWGFFAEAQMHDEKSRSQAESQQSLRECVQNFWSSVDAHAEELFKEHSDQQNLETFLKTVYGRNMSQLYVDLRSIFARWISEPESFTLILLSDEARPLCEISAYDGKRLVDKTFFDSDGVRDKSTREIETDYPFSNFRALKRALRLLLFISGNELYPRLFALFTDTSSRLSDFQPHPAISRSTRMYSEYEPGIKQFSPIYEFTSLDAYDRIECSPCLSDPLAVSDPERLIKFGRAGRYSLYLGKNANKQFYDLRTLAELAGYKLLYLQRTSHLELEQDMKKAGPKDLALKLLALLAVRLGITAGPSGPEAGELVASHLGVLVDVHVERPFLQVQYPSEPILAAVAALHLQVTGWDRPLMALCKYIDSSVVDAGFRGELLSKIVCLLAMDELLDIRYPMSPSSSPPPEHRPRSEIRPPNYWRYARPVKVRDYLDSLLVPPEGHESFSAALFSKYQTLETPEDKIHRFLNGWVFFNHCVRCEIQLSIELMVRAWNRGAALICKRNAQSFDFAIPVMLEPTGITDLGPMFGKWTNGERAEGCRRFTIMFINSKNFYDSTDHDAEALGMAVTRANFKYKDAFDKSGNIYLSILQEFGPQGGQGSVTFPHTRSKKSRPLMVVVLNGYGGDTYNCLVDLPPNHPKFNSRKLTQEAIKQLKERVGLRGSKDDNNIQRVALLEGFFEMAGPLEERWFEDWTGIKAQYKDTEMPDISYAALEMVLDEDDQMEISH